MARFEINPRRPWRHAAEGFVVVLLLAIAGYVAYSTGREESKVEFLAVEADRNRTRMLGEHLHNENGALRERLAVLERVRQIERKAYTSIEASLRGQQDEILSLRQELAFYRGIVASSNPDRGLTIRSLEIFPDRSLDGRYRFEVVLTRLNNSDKVTLGRVSLVLSGEENGKRAQRTLPQISDRRAPDIRIQFKHYQKIDGQIVVPKNFVPFRVLVKVVTVEEERPETVERAFEWPVPIG